MVSKSIKIENNLDILLREIQDISENLTRFNAPWQIDKEEEEQQH